jgi:acetyl esterase/lipase
MRRYLIPLLVLAPLLFAVGARADVQSAAYGPDPQEQLDICTPAQMVQNAPAVVMIHGGGWRNGSRRGLDGACKLLARQGIVAFDMDYRLLTAAPETKWPAQVNDAQLAMRWVRAHASAYGIDPRHICAEGDSAGAHMALLLDVLNAIHPGDRAGIMANISPRADCVVSISGPGDLPADELTHPNVTNFLFGSNDPATLYPQKRDASPVMFVRPGDGPALFIHGLQDPLVPFAQATEMQNAFARVGTPAWLISHEGGHEFNGMTKQQSVDIWTVIGMFIKARGMVGSPREVDVNQVLK